MLRHASRSVISNALRTYSTQTPNVPVKLIAELRKQTTVSMTKAREALVAANNDVAGALAWLADDIAVTGAKKAAKLADRSAKEGLVSLALMNANAGRGEKDMGVRAALIELNCETDFVARNELFGQLADDIAHTVAFHAEQSRSAGSPFIQPSVVDSLLEAPLMPANQTSSAGESSYATVGSAIRDNIARLGENISLRRALSVAAAPPPSNTDMRLRLASYIHNAASRPTQGRIAGLALLGLKSKSLATRFDEEAWLPKLERLERALIRQTVGYETTSVSGEEETALYRQPFDMFPDAEGATVQEALAKWSKKHGLVDTPEEGGVAVLEFVKWSVGEDI